MKKVFRINVTSTGEQRLSFVHTKVLPIILSKRLRANAEKITGYYQKGLRTNRGTIYNLHILR